MNDNYNDDYNNNKIIIQVGVWRRYLWYWF